MIVRNTLTGIVFIGILCSVQAEGDRWSRQISNSEWIPLANPRSNQRSQGPAPVAATATAAPAVDSSGQAAGQVPVLSLPPALQQQYQDQLLQLQKTQESIQRLLLLQQQLKQQQHILQSQAYQPNGFPNSEDDKQALHQSTIVNLQTLPELAPEVLVPPVPSSEALPPVFRPQDFHPPESTELKHDHGHRQQHTAANSPVNSEQDYRQSHEESIPRGTSHRENGEKDYRVRPKSRYEGAQRHKEEPSHVNFVTPGPGSAQVGSDEQEEVQLVYVPAETLAQRGQNKLRPQSRKHHPNRHHSHDSSNIPSHDAYAREILHQLQRQHDEKNQFFNTERQKEITRLQEEQRELERQARIHQEVVRRQQEIMRQREDEKKRKELDEIEEQSRQRELHRIKEMREKEQQNERELAEFRTKEEELERLSRLKDKEIRRQKEYDQREEHEARTRAEAAHNQGLAEVQSHTYDAEQPNAQALVREPQSHHQHLTEIIHKNNKSSRSRSKPRSKLHNYQQPQPEYPDSTEPAIPSPNQPPLSVYMGTTLPDQRRVQLVDVLKTLKNARTIAVLDSFGPDTPRVFVGPRNLDTPVGYAKFDLPYLSSIENNRVERKVDKLPFFVAPLSFEPPPGYSKIPFPAPHIGSVVINSLENVESKPNDNQNPTPRPLIEPNSYFVSNQPLSTNDGSTPVSYFHESSTPRYEVSSLPPSQSSTKWRFSEFYENKPSTEIPSAVTAASYNEERTPTSKFERPTKTRNYYSPNELSTTPNYHSPKTVSAFAYESTSPQSTPSYREDSASHHNVEPHLIDQNIGHHRQVVNRYHESEPQQQTNQRFPVDPTGHTITNTYFLNPSSSYEDESQYNLPAELPAISPQLPGLVNALVEKQEIVSTVQPPTTTPIITTSTTTTTETPTTTYRPRTRQRGRVTAARATTTTLSPPVRGNSERSRRPVNRSRSKYTTTTEDYRDSAYDPTRRNSVTTSRYDEQESYVRKATPRVHYKSREDDSKESSQIVDSSGSSEQGQRGNAYENIPLIDPASPVSGSGASLQPGGTPTADLNIPVYQHDDYSASTASSVDNYSSHRDTSISDSILPLTGLEYTRKSTHSPSYQTSPTYESSGSDEQPINGFNYRTHEDSPNSQTTRDFPYYRPGKTESVLFEPLPTTDLPNVQRSQLQDFSPVYHSVSAQSHYDKNETPRPVYREQTSSNNGEESPIFLPISHDKQEEYAYQTTVTEVLPEVTTPTTTTTTTEAPVIIRQRVRARLGGRTQTDSTIQTRPRGSQDEYVRFSAVNQDAPKPNSRQRTSRPRVRGHQHSPIQTDGGEYVRIQTAPTHQRRLTTSATTPQTTRTTESERPEINEDEEYGFIRQPNYRPPAQPQQQQQQPTNYKTAQAQSTDAIEATTATEASHSQAQILKNRQKYFSATRRPSSRVTTTPRTDETTYTARQRTRGGSSTAHSDEAKPTKARTRLRRPGSRKRVTTTTTENALDANNELPLDENYPRAQNDAASRGQDLANENYPQEFLLNYGASQNYQRGEYDQTQLASDSSRRSSASRVRPTGSRTSQDIYGAESQWSTKLTGNSFQPSSYEPNQPSNDGPEKSVDALGQEKAGSLPEIITAGPDVPSITVLVSSDDDDVQQRHEPSSSSEESIMDSMMNTMIDFGKKMNAPEEAESATNLPESQTQTTLESSTAAAAAEVKSSATFKKAGLRRRRVRVRVRPAGAGSEDFVTAESQSYDSSLNQLPRDTNKFRNFYVSTEPATTATATTAAPTTTSSSSSSSASELSNTEKSVFESFLDKMLGENEEETATTIVPEAIITTTTPAATVNPDDAWTSQSTIAPTAEVSHDEATTLGENSSPTTSAHRSFEHPTTVKNREEEATDNTELPAIDTATTMIDSDDAYPSTSTDKTSTSAPTTTSTNAQKDEVKSNSGENVIQSLNPENSLRYFVTKSPAFNEYLRSQENSKKTEMTEDNPDYPKNHRSKWSEVRYPTDKSVSDFTKWNAKNQSGEARHAADDQQQQEQQQQQQSVNTEADNSSVTDYVKAIFESIKSADEEHHQNAKLADQTFSSSRQDKELFKTETTTAFPTEVKTSVSSSSRVVARPASVRFSKSQSHPQDSTTTTTTESATFGPFVPSMMFDRQTAPVKKTSFETNLGKILRTSTTTKVSHMTEICYRGRCVMSKPKKDGVSR